MVGPRPPKVGNALPMQPSRNFLLIRDAQGELHHYCHPLADPKWLDATGASHLRADDAVLGLAFDGGAWALPWWIMKNHHMANLVLNGRPVFVALCEVCSSAAAYDPLIDGRRHTFRLDAVHNGTNMAIDYETGSRWPVPLGEATEGPLLGRKLERLPLLQCTWREWTQLQPDTLVPDGDGESREGHGEGHTPGGSMVGRAMVRSLLRPSDRRLPHCELVLGVAAGGESRCYPLAALARHGTALNDTLGGEEIAVFSHPGSWMASACRRRLDRHCLTFRSEGNSVFDEPTGSQWDISGLAISGPLAGRQLKYVHSSVEEFFIWAAFHPQTGIYGHEAPARRMDGGGWSVEMLLALMSTVLGKKSRSMAGQTEAWWTRGARVLDIGCGDGVIAAWLAEAGLEVLAVDASAEQLAAARERFRRVPRLKLERMDLHRPLSFPEPFDALIDHSHLARLAPGERALYASNLAAAARPGARCLIVLPVRRENVRRAAERLRRLFQRTFDLVDHARAIPVPHPVTGQAMQGAAFRLVRRARQQGVALRP